MVEVEPEVEFQYGGRLFCENENEFSRDFSYFDKIWFANIF